MDSPPTPKQIEGAYALAKERYAMIGVDTDQALSQLAGISISLHCWQGDDVSGFENPEAGLGGGLAATGNYPGKARTADELRSDLDRAYSLVPGSHRLNLHAIYAETGGRPVARDQLQPAHFLSWVDWARMNRHGIDFNPTCFSHPLAESGFTLSSYDPGIRSFWVQHCIACRVIGAHFGRELGSPCITNIWIPDGYKDLPVDRTGPRALLAGALDQVFADAIDPRFNLDSVEGKLFGLGSEGYVTGSQEFYLGYAITRRKLLCLDTGHYHPTEQVSDKISSVLQYLDEILLHVSRGIHWDSDHVVILSDELQAIMQEVVLGGYLNRVHIGLDYFDASINRVAAWVIGLRSALKALLMALLLPAAHLREIEQESNFTARLALLEEMKSMPFGAIWDYRCLQAGVPIGASYLDEIRSYEQQVLSKRV